MRRISAFLPIVIGVSLLCFVVMARPRRQTAGAARSHRGTHQQVSMEENETVRTSSNVKIETSTSGRTATPPSLLIEDRRKALVEVATRLKAGEPPPAFTWEPNEEEVKFLITTLTQQ